MRYASVVGVLAALGMVLMAAGQTRAELLYQNGSDFINGTVQSYLINSGTSVTDSFTLASNSTFTGVNIGLWADTFANEVPPSTVQWSIGTAPYGSDVSSGTGIAVNQGPETNEYGCTIYDTSIPLHGTANPGTYWITLTNATPMGTENYGINLNGWDEYWNYDTNSGGPSSAYQSGVGAIPSESFQIIGNVGVPTPEPSTLILLGIGAISLLAFARRRRRTAA